MPGTENNTEPVAIPITGELDLHTFRPAEVGDLVENYLNQCHQRGIRMVRIVHGKGTGILRATVQWRLRQSALVAGFAVADETAGGWGATMVTLKSKDSC